MMSITTGKATVTLERQVSYDRCVDAWLWRCVNKVRNNGSMDAMPCFCSHIMCHHLLPPRDPVLGWLGVDGVALRITAAGQRRRGCLPLFVQESSRTETWVPGGWVAGLAVRPWLRNWVWLTEGPGAWLALGEARPWLAEVGWLEC